MRNNDALTAEEVAELLKVSRSSVYKLVKSDELAAYFVGRKMRFTLHDVENYIERSRRAKACATSENRPAAQQQLSRNMESYSSASSKASSREADVFVLAGSDIVGDMMANYLGAVGLNLDRIYEGSYNALVDMYKGRAHAALVHIFEGSDNEYNKKSVRSLVPGIPVRLIHLVKRRQGLIVAKGNPKNLRSWDDLLRPGVTLANRERGCGSRMLFDAKLAERSVPGANIAGYDREVNSALSMASLVMRGGADVGIGSERVFQQTEGVDFIPLQDEWLDVALAKFPGSERGVEALTRLTRMRAFRNEVDALVGYDASHMGEVVFED